MNNDERISQAKLTHCNRLAQFFCLVKGGMRRELLHQYEDVSARRQGCEATMHPSSADGRDLEVWFEKEFKV